MSRYAPRPRVSDTSGKKPHNRGYAMTALQQVTADFAPALQRAGGEYRSAVEDLEEQIRAQLKEGVKARMTVLLLEMAKANAAGVPMTQIAQNVGYSRDWVYRQFRAEENRFIFEEQNEHFDRQQEERKAAPRFPWYSLITSDSGSSNPWLDVIDYDDLHKVMLRHFPIYVDMEPRDDLDTTLTGKNREMDNRAQGKTVVFMTWEDVQDPFGERLMFGDDYVDSLDVSQRWYTPARDNWRGWSLTQITKDWHSKAKADPTGRGNGTAGLDVDHYLTKGEEPEIRESHNIPAKLEPLSYSLSNELTNTKKESRKELQAEIRTWFFEATGFKENVPPTWEEIKAAQTNLGWTQLGTTPKREALR